MGRLVGMMLMQMPAEDSFWLLVATIEEYMVGYFTPTLSQVKIDSIVFEKLLFEHDSRLAQHLVIISNLNFFFFKKKNGFREKGIIMNIYLSII